MVVTVFNMYPLLGNWLLFGRLRVTTLHLVTGYLVGITQQKGDEAGSRKKVAAKAAAAVTVEDSESEGSPVSPGTIVVPKPAETEDLATHPGRKASRPNDVMAEQLEYQNRS